MSMTKKDFELVADVINVVMHTPDSDPATVSLLIGKMADRFSLEYERFDRTKFLVYGLRGSVSLTKEQ